MTAPAFEPRRFGAYALEARLGHGGMAEVFRATRAGVAGFARQCVVKRILGHHSEDPSFVDMFINEAKIAAKLTHPNISQVYELGQVDGEFFIAMEYVKGKDLLRVLRELAKTRTADPSIPPALAAYVARDTCRALQHAHDHTDESGQPRPIIHRDISPQNIMISYDGMIKLVDFGIAKALGSMMREETRAGALKGKFAYMAPEQISGQSPGPSADVFATGVVLHEMLTGRRLFKGSSDLDTLDKVRNLEVSAPSSINPRVPPELDTIVLRALERDRSKRYEKASQMARDLDGVLQNARFSVEEMVEFMLGLFPADKVEPSPQGHVTKEYPLKAPDSISSPRATNTPSGRGSDRFPRGSDSLGRRAELTPSGGTGGRRAVFVAAALAVVVGTGTILLVTRQGAPDPAVHTSVMALPEKSPSTEPPVASPETRLVRVRSEPAGARVFDGPRLVGEAPVEMKIPVDSPGVSLTLVREGRADLIYLVRPADAPELTLRLPPAASSVEPVLAPPISRGAIHKVVRGASRTPTKSSRQADGKPKVEIFDDTQPVSTPKVNAIDNR